MPILATHPEVALPPGADTSYTSDDWEPEEDGYQPYRVVWSKPFHDEDVRVAVVQYDDGRIGTEGNDRPLVYAFGDDFSPADARQIAEALTAAADLADKWVGVTDTNPVEPAEGDLLVYLQDERVTLQLDSGRPVVLETGEALVFDQHIIALAAGARR